jgi:hypothetical protein
MSARIAQSSSISGSSSVRSAVTISRPAGTGAVTRLTGISYSFSLRSSVNPAADSAASAAVSPAATVATQSPSIAAASGP